MFDGTKVQKISEIAIEKRNYFGIMYIMFIQLHIR
jgi:hypothetical protein